MLIVLVVVAPSNTNESVATSRVIDTLTVTPAPKVSRPVDQAAVSESATVKSPHVATPSERVVTDGKFFRVGSQKFHPKGVTYGPFKPDETGGTFPKPEQVERDFELMNRLRANCLRVYHVPPRWFLDLAE